VFPNLRNTTNAPIRANRANAPIKQKQNVDSGSGQLTVGSEFLNEFQKNNYNHNDNKNPTSPTQPQNKRQPSKLTEEVFHISF
jgi:hypothetical protein